MSRSRGTASSLIVLVGALLAACGQAASPGASGAERLPTVPEDGVYEAGVAYAATDTMARVVAELPPLEKGSEPLGTNLELLSEAQKQVINAHDELFAFDYVAPAGKFNDCDHPQPTALIPLSADKGKVQELFDVAKIPARFGTCDDGVINLLVDEAAISQAEYVREYAAPDAAYKISGAVQAVTQAPWVHTVVLTVSELSNDLRRTVAERYPDYDVALLYRPDSAAGGMPAASRDADRDPFYAGSSILHYNPSRSEWRVCSFGASWRIGGEARWIYAGHCWPLYQNDRSAYTPTTPGVFTYAAGEPLNSTLSGDCTAFTSGDGDLAIGSPLTANAGATYIGRSTAGRNYDSGPTSSSSHSVNSVWGDPVAGMQHRRGGQTTGVQTDFYAYSGNNSQTLDMSGICRASGPITVVGQQWISNKSGVANDTTGCGKGGDSGGPIFKYDTSTGKDTLYGIFSSMAGSGSCQLYWTRLYQAYQRWGGNLAPSA